MAANAQKIIDVYNKLDGDKGALKSHLREISELMLATKFLYEQWTQGGKRQQKIYDGTAIRAHRVFANGLYGNLSPQSVPWFSLTTKNKTLAENSNVKFWLADTTERMRNAINSSNAPLALQQVYRAEGWAGTAVLYVDAGRRYAINCQTFSVGNCCITEDADGIVDGLYRIEKFTARQMVQKWGDKVSEKVKKAYEGTDNNKQFDVIHAVYPRDDYDWRKMDNLNMPFASAYVEMEAKKVLSESGFQEFPYAVPRWEKDDGEVYGRSPGMDALPDAKMLNQMCYDNMRGIQKAIDPVILATKETALSGNSTRAGGIIYHKSGEPPTTLNSNGRFDIALEVENQRREAIRESFYNDLFLLLAQQDNQQKTAYEVRQLVEEKLSILGPALGRQQTELFDPLLTRVFWILFRTGYLLPVPQELKGQGLSVEYVGRLALAMKAQETQATGTVLSFVGQLAEARPEIMDNFDVDEIAQGTAMRAGMPIKYMVAPDVRDKQRAARAQAAEQEKQDMQLEALSNQIPNLSKAPEGGSVIDGLNKAAAGGRR